MQAANNVLEYDMGNTSKPFKLAHLQNLAIKSTLNEAHVIETTKVLEDTFMKARNSLVVRCRERKTSRRW